MVDESMQAEYDDFEKRIEQEPENIYKKWQELAKSNPSLLDDIEFLWRYAKACIYWGNSMPKKEPKRKELIYEGLSYATKAYDMNRDHFEALRWTAVLCGATTDYLGIKERINTAKQFKVYLDMALEKEPTEYVLLHLRGRFSYEMASLSWVEKKICSTIFAKVPERTYDDALTDFVAADKYSPNVWPENKLYIARCYCKKREKKPAEEYLKEVEAQEKKDDAVKEGIQDVQGMILKIK